MSEELIGNVLVAQSGGPTAVINSSLAGVITEALNHDCIEEIYGSLNGVMGILNENFIDLAEESQQTVRALRFTPGAALGTCRYKLKKEQDFDRIINVLMAHNIRYFFYIGGNDSQDTANKISKCAADRGYEMRVIGIPKTVDNDLPITDHCPGYGSVIKHIATMVREMAEDHESMGQHDLVSIVEVMGRNAGWIAAGAALAKHRNNPEAAPHLIYLPEIPFSTEKFLEDVQMVLQKNKHCMIVVSEGLVDKEGNYIAASANTDSFGHFQLGGVSEHLSDLISENINVNVRTCKLGISQRAAATHASQTDSDEAFLCGQQAVKVAVAGQTNKMVTLIRQDSEYYSCGTGLASLEEVANGVKTFPKNWINEEGNGVTHPFIKYALPLIFGEVQVTYELGLPQFASLAKNAVEKKLTGYVPVQG